MSTLPDLVMELHAKFSTPERMVLAYKGGIQEKFLLYKLGLPCLDFEDLGCPRFDQLIDYGLTAVVISTCDRISSLIVPKRNVISLSLG